MASAVRVVSEVSTHHWFLSTAPLLSINQSLNSIMGLEGRSCTPTVDNILSARASKLLNQASVVLGSAELLQRILIEQP